jgi:chemotaxis receptor (MCP) glutamine deamidase CheD
MSKIHPRVLEYFKQVNQGWNSNGTKDASRANDNILDKKEVEYAKKNISVFLDYDVKGFKIEAGMTIEDMIEANPFFRSICTLGDKNYTPKSLFSRLFFSRNKADDDKKSVEVGQGHYAVKTYSKDCTSIQTDYINDCVAVTIYDKKHKRGFIAHFDTVEKIYDFKNLIKQLSFNPSDCEARIIGGRTNMSEGKVELLDNILQQNKFNIVEIDVLGTKERAIQMDLNTGEVFDYEETNKSTFGRDETRAEHTQTLYKNKFSD